MNDKHPLSSEQALDDYFFDLLAEPEEVEAEAEVLDSEEALPAEQQPLANETAAVDDKGGDNTAPAQNDAPACTEPVPEEPVGTSEAKAPAAPFDFGGLDEPGDPSDSEFAVELELSVPAGKMSGWEPQLRELKPEPEFQLETDVPASFADQPHDELEGVQRLLSQVSLMQADTRQQPLQSSDESPDKSVDETAGASQPQVAEVVQLAELRPEPDSEHLQAVAELTSETIPEIIAESEPETGLPEHEVQPALETQAGGDEPPEPWQQQQAMGDTFQALFFEVNGVTFAVPLTQLGGIHQLGDVNRLLGRPPWYLGLMTSREHQLDVVDTACWVMPEKLVSDDHQEQYRYIVMLGESKWGLACNALHGTETLTEHSVRWREKAGKRPWLAGMVKEKMCALIHVSELIAMLNAGLDVKSVI